MNSRNLICSLVIFFIIVANMLTAQTVSGYVMDEDNNPLPYVNVYVKYTSQGTVTDDQGHYFLRLDQGDYDLVFSSVGYETKEIQVLLQQSDIKKNIYLATSAVAMEEIIVKAKGRDPAYEIIQNAIDAKKQNNKQVMSSRCDVYIKAKEVISEKERKRREREQKDRKRKQDEEESNIPDDPAKKLQQERMELANSLNITEVKLQRNYQYPNQVKEIRTAYEQRGEKEGLYFLTTNEASFNFYENLITTENLTEIPVISPLNTTAILTYKYKLEKTTVEDGVFVYHIKVSPRKQSGNVVEGYIDIVSDSYAIKRVDLDFSQLGLMYYDAFNLKQQLVQVADSTWVVDRQEFTYTTKMGRELFNGNTTVIYSNYELDVQFPKRYFKNEIAVTTQDAYDKDTAYWASSRPEPLTREEQRIIAIKDSIEAAHNTEAYLDSVDRAYNKVRAVDLLWYGVGFFNREKKRHIYLSGLAEFIDPFQLGGITLGPDFLYFKRTEDQRNFFFYINSSFGLRNHDIKGDIQFWYLYDPINISNVFVNAGHNFDMVQDNQSFTAVMDRANYVEQTYLEMGHSTEVFNGFYFDITGEVMQTNPIDQYKFGSLSEELVNDNIPRSFDSYQLFTLYFEADYTPFQKYLSEPNRKVVLGSKWPTISVLYEKGIPDVLGSDIDFDYLRVNISQDFKLGALGTSTYKLGSGKFLTKDALTYEVKKNFPRGDHWFFSTPMQNQLQDVTILSENWYFDAHYVHHFNGAIVNYIPLVKKLRIHALGGANYLYVEDNHYHYADFYFGLERVIRIQRQRFRLGVYFVYGGSNLQLTQPAIQFALNHYDKREKSWGY